MEGYFDKEKSLAGMLRIASFRIHQSIVGKDSLSIEEYWPLRDEEKKAETTFTADQATVEQIMKIHSFKHDGKRR